jgi:hypothetical protein
MAKSKQQTPPQRRGRRAAGPAICAVCGGIEFETDGKSWVSCPNCCAVISIDRYATTITVSGENADEVSAVSRQISKQLLVHREGQHLRSPWISGLFYLLTLVVIVVLLLALGRMLPIWALPTAIFGAGLLLSVTAALQMRQDDRLSERGFLNLMVDVFRRLPSLLKRSSRETDPE